jgi:hypothetical protein
MHGMQAVDEELTLVTSRAKPPHFAVALFSWQRRSADVDAFTLRTAILIGSALVPVLASRSVVVFIAFALCGEVLAMAAARLSVLFSWFNVNIGT